MPAKRTIYFPRYLLNHPLKIPPINYQKKKLFQFLFPDNLRNALPQCKVSRHPGSARVLAGKKKNNSPKKTNKNIA